MTLHTHTWHYLTTEDDGSRLVYEECCELCGKHRRKPYRYAFDFGPQGQRELGDNLVLYLLILAAGVTAGMIIGWLFL